MSLLMLLRTSLIVWENPRSIAVAAFAAVSDWQHIQVGVDSLEEALDKAGRYWDCDEAKAIQEFLRSADPEFARQVEIDYNHLAHKQRYLDEDSGPSTIDLEKLVGKEWLQSADVRWLRPALNLGPSAPPPPPYSRTK